MFTLALILFCRKMHLVWFPWQPCGGVVFNLLQSISYWSCFPFAAEATGIGYRLEKTASWLVLILFEISIVSEVLWLFILEVVLLPRTQAKNQNWCEHPPPPVAGSLCSPFSHNIGIHPMPTWSLIVSRVKAAGKRIFSTCACEISALVFSVL